MKNLFPEANTKLLNCLSPKNSFVSFNIDKLVYLTEYYSDDLSLTECMTLFYQVKTDCINNISFK